MRDPAFSFNPVPKLNGIGLKPSHYQEILETRPAVGWFEIHAENYMGEGGAPHVFLSRIRQDYPLSAHGVGLSLGGVDDLDKAHLARWRRLVDRYQPGLISEHLAWCGRKDLFLNDLLPLPLTEEALDVVARHVDQMQEALGRSVLVENPSTYLALCAHTISEPDFLVALARRTGCGLLLDINNVFVSTSNHDLDAQAWLDAIPPALVGEVHLAGHTVEEIDGKTLRIDDHGSPVSGEVWSLYNRFIERAGAKPTLIEWDTHVPAFSVLLEEARKTQDVLNTDTGAVAAHG